MPQHSAGAYYPRREGWERVAPEEVGMSSSWIEKAIEYHRRNETDMWPRTNMKRATAVHIAQEPFNAIIGPVRDRGGPNGLILRHGYIVAEWGDTKRVDMTFSVSKCFVSATAGLAVDGGLISDVHNKVAEYVHDGGFDSVHNSKITWHHLLNQTSDWEGTLWGKPDWADRPEGEPHTWSQRERSEPGTLWKYNDVRVNRLALSLLRVWREPLPRVLRENIMDPIGASRTWEWHGYDNSWVTVDGVRMQSVSGGGHWGGGMWISTRDLARFGYLYLRRGMWDGQQVLSESWIGNSTDPTPANDTYGYMNWWLNTDGKLLESASEDVYFATGGSSNRILVVPQHDLVAVVRWIEGTAFVGFVSRVMAALKDSN